MVKKSKLLGIILIAISIIIPLSSFSINKVTEKIEQKEITKKIEEAKDYFGILEIPKINFKKEIYNINDKRNNVNKNIYVHPKSIFSNNVKSNIIIAGHSGNGTHAYFKNLHKLKIDDEIKLYYQSKIYTYKIKEIEYQNKIGTLLLKEFNNDILVLITCTYHNSKTQTIYYAVCENIENIT